MRSWWEGRRVLVTGHTGFKGAWLTLWLERLGASVTGLALPPEDPAGAFSALGPWPALEPHMVDLRDGPGVAEVIAAADPEVVLHLGAQALVRRSYADPAGTWAVNVVGTANVLEAARALPSVRSVVVVTSDKVYANLGDGRPFTEDDRLGGHDPYSSSKAAAELATASWRRSYFDDRGVGVATARAGNVIGGGDRGEDRLLPDLWRALESGAIVRLRYPLATRPWQFVLEPLHGYLLLAQALAEGHTAVPHAVNFGPGLAGCVAVGAIVDRAITLWGAGRWEQEPVRQPHEAHLLHLDASLATSALGWRPQLDVETAVAWTVEWWRAAAGGDDLRKLAESQIDAYEDMVRS